MLICPQVAAARSFKSIKLSSNPAGGRWWLLPKVLESVLAAAGIAVVSIS